MSKHTLQWIPPATLKASGVIDEDVRFDPYLTAVGAEVVVDFSGVTRINSCGVREWTKALARTHARIRYVCVPTLIVDQFSMVPEFLGPNSEVESFDARFVCPDCSFEETVRLRVGTDVVKAEPAAPPRPCGRCGRPSEFDHNADVYLEFLRYVK